MGNRYDAYLCRTKRRSYEEIIKDLQEIQTEIDQFKWREYSANDWENYFDRSKKYQPQRIAFRCLGLFVLFIIGLFIYLYFQGVN